ncbi:MAG: galactose mutarotase [Clostridia bacterium]|nr:galactose mutarotase [Clostridia bacterium]
MINIQSKEFGKIKDGRKVTAYEMSNSNGMSVRILDYGCTIQSITVPDEKGVFTDVVLGYDDISSYENGSCYYGAIVGRYANRIGDARFMLDGKEYLLEKTSENEPHHLHGVYAKRLFEGRIEDGSVAFKYLSPDKEERFPGNLSIEVRYVLSEDNALELSYTATTDAPTILNLTNHCYFNLNGQDGSTVFDHKVWLNSSNFTEYTETFAQTGRIIPVFNTPLDFTKEQTIGARFDDDYHQFRICTGYDHNMVLDGKVGELKPIGTAKSDKSGICLEAFTTEPAIQFYSANFIHFDSVPKGKNGVRYPKNGGFCFEAQHYPDSMNHKNFPNVILRPGETYKQKTIYRLKLG